MQSIILPTEDGASQDVIREEPSGSFFLVRIFMYMTKEELIAERSWLSRKANRSHPNFQARMEAFNKEVEIYNRNLNERSKAIIKTLKVGDIVSVKEEFNRKGLWRVEKIMQKNIILKSMTDTPQSPRIKCSASIVTKIEGEDQSLVNILDTVGLI